jgi:hypothetical protein
MPRLPGRPGSRADRSGPEAPTTTTFQARSVPTEGVPSETTSARERVGRQAWALPLPRRERVVERRALIAVLAIVAGIAGAAAISRSMSDVIEARAQVAEARAHNDGIRAQVESGRREIAFGQGDAYLRFAARGLGYGREREVPFALRAGADPAPSIEPLGAGQHAPREDALASFLDLLLGP